jgi:hypothetical protein
MPFTPASQDDEAVLICCQQGGMIYFRDAG